MNSMINGSRLLAVALCGFALAGCDSVKDVRSAPSTELPPGATVLDGTIAGLGTRRPVYLDSGITLAGHERERTYFGDVTLPATPFSYGSVPNGTPYNFTVRIQPYGKICTVANGSGIVGDGSPKPAVTCADDMAVSRYRISGTVPLSVANLPGATAILTTEDAVEELPLAGLTAFQFTSRVMSPPQEVPPAYDWSVTARYTENGKVYNCRVANGFGSRSVAPPPPPPATAPPPPADVTNVAIQACSFPVTGTVRYSILPGETAPAIGTGGVTIEQRRTGDAVPELPPRTINAFSASAQTLWPEIRSYSGAVFDLAVASHPAGQTCLVTTYSQSVPSPTPSSTTATTALGTALWVSSPPAGGASSSATWNPAGIGVRCRNTPAPANQLTGLYRRITRNSANAITARQFLAFFADGTFLFSSHSATLPAGVSGSYGNGVERGFYVYDAAAGTLDFILWADSSVYSVISAAPISLSNTPGYTGAPATTSGITADGGLARAANVVKTSGALAEISFSFTGAVSGATVTSQWTMTEPRWFPGEMAGGWLAEGDNRRLFVFNFDDTTATHAGANGPINMQAACIAYDDRTASSGYFTRRTGLSGCLQTDMGFAAGFGPLDVAGRAGTVLPPGFVTVGMFPGMQTARDGRPPSPILYEIVPGSPDTLTVQQTENGTPVGAPQTFRRAVFN